MILAVFCLVAASAWPAAARPTVVDVRLGVHPDKTRFVMEVTDADRLPGLHAARSLPRRRRFSRDDWNNSANQTSGAAGSVLNFRYAPYKPGTMRLVLNVSGPVRVREAFVLPPRDGKQPRFVLDLEPVSPAVFASEMNKVRGTHVAEQPAGATYTLPVATGAAVVSRPVPALPEPPMDTVAVTMSPGAAAVIPPQMPPPGSRSGADDDARLRRDPGGARRRTAAAEAAGFADRRPARHRARSGHGGVDPGAISVTGAFEKELTLAMARVVRDHLAATGRYRVVLTRDSDVFLRLRDRVAKAREAGAELFISLHADSIGSSDVRGMSIYSLSENASDKEAATLAARENRADALDGINLTAENDEVVNILISLAQRDTMNQSRRFANMLVDEMGRQTRLVPRPHRSAGFAVLTAPDIPSVLIELGYLSSPQDAKLLGQTEHRATHGAFPSQEHRRVFCRKVRHQPVMTST